MKTLNEISRDTLERYLKKSYPSGQYHEDEFNKRAKKIKSVDDIEARKYHINRYSRRMMGQYHAELKLGRPEMEGEKPVVPATVRKTKNNVIKIKEDAIPTNTAGSGAIKGIGTGSYPDSEPGVPKKRLKVILNKAKMLTRKNPNV